MLVTVTDTYLVAGFKSAIIVTLLLHGVIGQMYHTIGCVFQVVLAATRPKVPVCVPVRLQVSVLGRAERVAPNVELPILVQERLLDVLLNDIAAPVAVYLLCLNQTLDVIQVATDLDTATSVRVLSRLYDPELVAVLWVLSKHLVVLWIVVCLLELEEFSISFTFFNMKCQRDPIERVLS